MAHPLLPETQMRMSIYKSREDAQAAGIDYLSVIG
jgi:hypothetical protein